MKTRLTHLFLLLVVGFSMLGCKKELQPINLTLELTSSDQGVTFKDDQLTIASKGTEKDAVLTLKDQNGQDFATESIVCEVEESAQDWCTVRMDGKNLNVSVKEYMNKEESRKANVKIFSDENTIVPLNFTVMQMPKAKSTEARMLAFSFKEQATPAVINEDTKTVSIKVKRGTELKGLVPTIEVSEGAIVSPESGAAQDFNSAVEYTVTAEDGESSAKYIVSVNKEYGPDADKAEILAFVLKEQEELAVIDHAAKTVAVKVKYDTDLTALVPEIEVTDGAAITPESGAKQDFTSPVEYTVTSENGEVVSKYLVSVSLGFGPNADKAEILAFHIEGQLGESVIDNENHTVAVNVSTAADMTDLTAQIEITEGATMTPAIEEVKNFSAPVELVLTSEDKTTVNTYTVTVTAKKNSEALVESFTVGDAEKEELIVEGVINQEASTIVLNIPYSDDWPWGWTAKYNAVLSPGATDKMDFNNWDWSFKSGAKYTVTSEDESTTKVYEITAEMGKNPNADLVSFVVYDPETGGQPKGFYSVKIDNAQKTILVRIKEGTDVSNTHVKIEASTNAEISCGADAVLNLNGGDKITITSEDGEHTSTYSMSTAIVKLSDFNIEMVDVQAGTFMFGESTDPDYNKNYAQEVTLTKDFQISKYEMTQDMFEILMGINNSPNKGDRYPISHINWYEAAEFCNRLSDLAGLTPAYEFSNVQYNSYTGRISSAVIKYNHETATGYRLPTNAEFEWAAKGGVKSKNYLFAGGNDASEVAWYEGNSAKYDKKPQEVGGKAPNELGLFDMSGNVDEWVYDWNLKVPYGEIPDYADVDPIGGDAPTTAPNWNDYKIFRGGAATSALINISLTDFRYTGPSESSQDRGFRIAITK